MGKIFIIGLGPGDEESLTFGALNKFNNGERNFLRTEKHPTVNYLKRNNIPYSSYDFVYEKEQDFQGVYKFIVNDLIEKSEQYGIINYFVPGNPLVAEKTVNMLIELEKKDKVDVEIISGMSFLDPVLICVHHDPINGIKVLDGLKLKGQYVDINVANIITQVYNKRVASSVKLALSEVYGDEYRIYVINSAGMKEQEKIFNIPLYELDRIDEISYLTSIYIPKVDKIKKKNYDLNNLITIMEKLRSKEGCPWDIKQTHSSIRECVIEEAYEVVDAIDRQDINNLMEELGDLLLQVVFHSQIAREEGYFNIWDVTTNICEKLILRHPHVFNKKKVENYDQVIYNWNEIKFKNRKIDNYTDRLRNIPKLPSLMKSYKVQKRASDVGFDWNDVYGAFEKVKEEYLEVLQEIKKYKGGDVNNLENELGDLLFSIVNVCRFFKVNPEVALNKSINKFICRFEIMEQKSKQLGKDFKQMKLQEMNQLWNEAKIHKK